MPDATTPRRSPDAITFEQLGRETIELEAEALAALARRIDAGFARACELVLAIPGRVIVVGMGKSGHVGGKIAATLASTGTPAFFVHPGEASHGDLGMITPHDLVLAISNSGETDEILLILPIIKRMGAKLVALTGNPASTLARQADAVLHCPVAKEACPLNLAPTASTTAALAMGDALAVALLKSRGFTREDFARSHPAGSLGRRLLLYVGDIMHTGDEVPLVGENAGLREALFEMTSKGLGMTGVVDGERRLLGILTDGDLRRILNRAIDVHTAKVRDVMTVNPKVTSPDRLAAETVELMRSLKINGLFVVDDDGRVAGALNMHDLLRRRIV
ncbi:D-arabinose 5-phosphate isomerase [Sulfurifustis variabilis]|uniref:Arabinose 5-phosphate isomerase n=1 Tax=Sulfurifustis variabilis TaxID=1675686 RepID=A0A1B4VD14_9GAMM|nr:KpsF/GutQ family sugar-phosphate isomerase [Sulfurifustis variabilis]BAU47207.1 D-arabinose 5-phosphate isomerase [Sulfurifustis variabilis]